MLSHGSGGGMSQRLISDLFLSYLDSDELAKLDDAAELKIGNSRLAFSTDTFIVKPIFFPGGDIGSLAVSGTVNDILMQGGKPLYLSLGFIIEEGFPIVDLERILSSIRDAAREAGVSVVTGDTKVVSNKDMDGIFINTSGIGLIPENVDVRGANAREGDSVIVSGSIGAHGVAVMVERNGLKWSGDIKSDAAPMTNIVVPLLSEFGGAVHVLRDPTRGGVATTLNEIASSSKVTIAVEESSIPVDRHADAVGEILGIEPLYMPCEGRFLAFVEASRTEEVLDFIRSIDGRLDPRKIGQVEGHSEGQVHLVTRAGGTRILDVPVGELLPRIC
jgi:hydrogenase expression/formation protein HypE